MRSREQTDDPFVNLSDLTEIELLILQRMREFTHRRSSQHVSRHRLRLRRVSATGSRAIAWRPSTGRSRRITNFSPLIVRDFDQPSTAGVMAVADVSPSTRCGVAGAPDRRGGRPGDRHDRHLGGVLSGYVRLDHVRRRLQASRSRAAAHRQEPGDSLPRRLPAQPRAPGRADADEPSSARIAGYIRKPSLVPVISDFLFDDAKDVIAELTPCSTPSHDVILVLIDSAFAFEMPPVSPGWVEAFDVETGRSRVMSRATLRGLAGRAREWQDDVQQMAKDAGHRRAAPGSRRDRERRLAERVRRRTALAENMKAVTEGLT